MSDAADSDTDSKDILNRAVPPSNMVSKTIPGRPIARLFCKNRFEFLINKTRVLVGRSGGDMKGNNNLEVDISIDGCSLYISRRHFDIFTSDCVKFFVSVYSKNGLFVNGLFLKRGSAAFQLKNQSRLRFPKTDLKILFQIFTQENEPGIEPGSVSHDLISKEENGRGDADQFEDKLPTTLQTYNNMYQQQHQQQQPYQLGQQTSPGHHQQQLISPMNSPDKNQNNPFAANAALNSKLEREVFKQQSSQHIQQQQQQLPAVLNNPNSNLNPSNPKKRKFTDMPESMASNHQQLSQDWGSRGDYSDGRKPPFSYSQLIAQAIFSTPDHMLCLNDIYMFITKTYPFYRPEEKGWQNSIRHNLSLSKSFVRMPRANDEGKGSLWTIQYNDKQNMMKTAYRPRGTRDKYNHHHHQPQQQQQQSGSTPARVRMLTESMSSVGDSEDSQDMYQNEDEEAANSIALAGGQGASEGFTFAVGDQFGDGDSADQLGKPTQAAILQSSFANPMQIFMQPDRRGLISQQQQQQLQQQLQQQQQQQQQISLGQLHRANISGSGGSVQVVRLTVNPNTDAISSSTSNTVTTTPFGSFQKVEQDATNTTTTGATNTTWHQQQQPQQIFIQQQQQQQPQQIRIQQQQVTTGTGQRIIILRAAQQQQQQQQLSTDSTSTTTTTQPALIQQQPKKIILASGSNLSMLNGASNANSNTIQQRIIFSQQAQQLQPLVQHNSSNDVDELNDQILQGSGLDEDAEQQQQQNQQQQQQTLQFEMLTFEQQQQLLLELQKQQQQQEDNNDQQQQLQQDDTTTNNNNSLDTELQQQQQKHSENEHQNDTDNSDQQQQQQQSHSTIKDDADDAMDTNDNDHNTDTNDNE